MNTMPTLHILMLAFITTMSQATEPILLKATDFDRNHLYSWGSAKYQLGDPVEHLRTSGNLGSLPGEGTRGFIEYDFNIPSEGWYELTSLPTEIPLFGVEITLDDCFYYPLQKEAETTGEDANSLGFFHLSQGKHTLRFEIRALLPPFKKWTGFELKEVARENRIRIETTAPFVNEIVARKDSEIPFRVEYSDLHEDAVLTVRAINPITGTAVGSTDIQLPASEKYRTVNFSIPASHEGVFELRYERDGNVLTEKSGPWYTLVTIDTTPVPCSASDPEVELIREIDCVRESPDYVHGTNRIVTSKAGSFRESSRNSGWDMNQEDWFAYAFTVPEADALYKFEFDYPDDIARASHFAIRQKRPGYAKVLGINSGWEFRNSGEMMTGVLYTWIYEKNGNRIVVIPGGNRMPAAVSKIRISKVKGNTFSPLNHVEEGMRRIQYFYEETPSVVGMTTGEKFNHLSSKGQPETMLRAFERFCAQTAFFGATEHLYTIEIYGGGFWPSRYQPCRWTRPFRDDNVAKMLLISEKYGQNCIFDFHAVPMEFHPDEGELYTPENQLRNASGCFQSFNDLKFMINPIHPNTEKWRNEMFADFARRYKDYPNFKGIRIRNMRWQNSGWSNFHGQDWGYDDYTVGRFEQETGIEVPGSATDEQRYAKRAKFLRGEKKNEWMEWRAQKVTDLYLKVRDTIRDIRPDLKLYCNHDALAEKDYEVGIDADALRNADISVSYRTLTGRNPSPSRPPLQRRIESLMRFRFPSEPPESERVLHHWLVYYEGPQIAKNEEIGLPKEPSNWWGYAAWPAGRNELEFWALGLARRDASIMLTGTIGYGFGTPLMREFANEFSRLPVESFETLTTDPAAIRFYDKWFYAVNSLPVSVRVSIGLDGDGGAYRVTDGSKFDVSSFELKPFQLMAFTTKTKIKDASVQVPDSYVADMRALVVPAVTTAIGIPELEDICAKLEHAFDKQEFCEVRMLLELNRPLFEEHGITLPGLYNSGAPEIPAGALVNPKDTTQTIPARSLFDDWDEENLMTGRTIRFSMNASVSGEYRPQIGYIGGDRFGEIELLLDGKLVGEFPSGRGKSYFALVSMRDAFQASAGEHVLELRSKDKRDIALYYVDPVLQFRPVPCRNFLLSRTAVTGAQGHDQIREELQKPLPGDTDRKLQVGGDSYWSHSAPNSDPKVHGVYLGSAGEGKIRCALTHIYSVKPQTVQLMVGADYFWRLTINGELIDPFGTQGDGPARSDGKRYNIELKEGWNEILLKVASGSENHCLWLSITDPGGLEFSNFGPYTLCHFLEIPPLRP